MVYGSSDNRVDLVFFSDGYVPEEKQRFINDAYALALEITGNQTFNTVKPLLNIWAAFSPSGESGLGQDGVLKDTPFGLYRNGTELRAVYYGKPEVADAACKSLGSQCDYPILLGNSPLYGGLGGRFTVITNSIANGPLILRHELGHSIIPVGEEYDGGYAYSGVNAADTPDAIGWGHWLTTPAPRVERSVMPMQTYPWTLLNTSTPWSVTFDSAGTYSRYLVRFSLSGLPEMGDARVTIDGKDLGWTPKVGLGMDRWHYDFLVEEGLGGGEHELVFELVNSEREGAAQLCNAEIIEYGDEDEFDMTPGAYSIYPTYSETNTTTYRPTNEDCLMRLVTASSFCSVCMEGLWLTLLKDVDLIDGFQESCSSGHTLSVQLVPVGQFRDAAVDIEEAYTISWYKDGVELPDLANLTMIEVGDAETYEVKVAFDTEEVRVDKEGRMKTGATYVTKEC
ncbi:IgA peptidase M64-domain-containing protein [Schizophyllum amplum]|uniref:IgA peptidase M64-domain-containing protein n=1 Tax=Schizophyllum amplum TaxID=97359 RepID=A0A550BWR0_9AGAR|nr:IgA peptidase M64-domain-containing protein [Auriculariopsis ampla]